ncbi:MAG TPA: hypothetical protein DER60_05975 [Syntrophomonas sp.]|jgi:uncharacterized membrane protein YkvA (DUF1232 family)|nr:hypothetical protein [Syntrophomonas sp.]
MAFENAEARNSGEAAPGNAIQEVLYFIPNLLKMVYRLLKDEGVTHADRLLLLGTATYVLSPLDFLPDMIPALGQVDDILLLALVLKRLMNSVSFERLENYWDGSEPLLRLFDRVLDLSRYVIPAKVYDRVVKKSRR